MKKFILSVLVIVSFGLYVVFQSRATSNNDLSTPIAIVSKSSSIPVKKKLPSTNSNSQNQQLSTTTTTSTTSQKNGLYNDGEYVGSSVDDYYGSIQVKAIISNNKLTDIQFLNYPHNTSNSIRVNSRALPILKQEAIVAQSATIDAVSGASATSPAFIESLTSALNQAKA
jgi:uncharacterized protein with FMN-binding domain